MRLESSKRITLEELAKQGFEFKGFFSNLIIYTNKERGYLLERFKGRYYVYMSYDMEEKK